MAGAQPPDRRPAPISRTGGTDPSTRIDIKVRERPNERTSLPELGSSLESSDSIEIPIHITGSDLQPIQTPPMQARPRNPSTDFAEDLPTEIFRPEQHQTPIQPMRPMPVPQQQRRAPTGSSTQLSPQNIPLQRPAAGVPAHSYPGPGHAQQHAQHARPASVPPPPPAVDISGLVGDDWEVATVVKKPSALDRAPSAQAQARPAPQQGRPRDPRASKPFNPDETVAMHGDIDVEIDFDNDSTMQPPSRRR